ncbi:hypothetical protein Ciccas_014360 [Cichlidogyrus casuarinus]|uniref:C3H1-type domain-containing protein n=1 Tax=Cichlidogyrus casuarinus TaxID=1844966 RepID=A0ABD2PJ21_9PLAT
MKSGVDPKSVLCAYFKQGSCKKGDKCKFSHDLNVERKAVKRSVYEDVNQDANKEEMDDWDQAKLEEVVDQKHGSSNKGLPPTTIICKFFLDAVENSKYGWFWECPNGPKCHYRHALPPGFILKKDRKILDEQKDKGPTLEELIETERLQLGTNLTKVTYQTFMAWKQRKRKEAALLVKEDKAKKQKSFKSGVIKGVSPPLTVVIDEALFDDADLDDLDSEIENLDLENT